VCAAAGVDRSSVVYVEAHGTGTVVGDAQELGAIDRMYGAGAGRSADAPLLIGSVKSNMGHCEGCSGLAGAPPSSRAPAAAHCTVICVHDRRSLSGQSSSRQPVRAAAAAAGRAWSLPQRPTCTALHAWVSVTGDERRIRQAESAAAHGGPRGALVVKRSSVSSGARRRALR